MRVEFVNIDDELHRCIAESGAKDGICIVFVPHTTAAVTINENADPDVQRDIISELGKVIPLQDNYAHSEGNSAAHIKTSLVGSSETVLISNGRAKLGTWQSVFFCEFDGPRNRRVWFKIIDG
jgi:secondary thiamine-phosphate synthase enzyme